MSATTTTTGTTAVQQVIFIDSTVPDLQTLLDGVGAGAVAVVLDPGQDGVQQILDFLLANELSDLSAIQIVSHGSEGSITLGSTVLDNGNVVSFADALAQIGASLASGGDIMLYGCDVAGSAAGQQFINALASLTGADVAASTDLTGAAALGGDWTLEAATGSIEAGQAFTAEARSDFNALLVTNVLTAPAPEFSVETHTASSSGPVVTALTNGGFVVVWYADLADAFGGGGVGILGQMYDANHQKVGAQFQINSNGIFNGPGAGLTQRYPSVAALTDGGFVVAWQTDVNGRDIQAQRFDVDANFNPIFVDVAGNVVAGNTEFTVNTSTLGDQKGVSVTGRPDGGFVFTWGDSIDEALDNQFGNGFGYEIRERVYSATGVPSAEATVNTTTLNQQVLADVASQSDNTSVIVWQSLNQVNGTSLWDVFARKIDANGVPIGAEFQLNTTTALNQGAASIAALSTGGYIVVWTSMDTNFDNGHIFGRKLDANGTPVGTEFQIDNSASFPGSTKFAPSVVALTDGTFVVSWSGNGIITMRRFDASGATPTPTTDEFTASTLPFAGEVNSTFDNIDNDPDFTPPLQNQSYGFWVTWNAPRDAMALLADGSLVGVWTTLSGATFDVFARIFDVGLDSTPNNAPVLTDTVVTLNNVPEGSAAHMGTPVGALGTLISDLVDLASAPGGHDNVTDADAGDPTGIAITALNTLNGDWWYTTDGGTIWTQVGTVSNAQALLLAADANTRILFVADLGSPAQITDAITFRAWDLSVGANGSKLDTSINGGTSAFSTATDTASITVDPFNEAPVFTGGGGTRSFAEHDGPITLETNFVISDSDDLDLASATVTIQGFVTGDVLTINGSSNGALGAISFSFVNGVLTLTGDDSFDNYRDALELVQFQHIGENPTNFGTSLTRTITWTVDDGHPQPASPFTLFNPPSAVDNELGWARTPRDVAVADFNGDGNLDFVAAMSESGANRFNLVVRLGNGDGTFGPQDIYAIEAGLVNPRDVGLELGLFNNDDLLLDIAVTGSTSDQVFVFLGAANGKFTPQINPQPFPFPPAPGYATGSAPQAIASADFDHDNEIDFVVGNANSISFLHGNGDGTFVPDPFTDQDLQNLGSISGIAAADIDGDGNVDIVASDQVFGVSVFFGDGTGGFDPHVNYAAGTSPAGLAVADLNNDTRLDIVVTNFGSNDVSVLLQNADHTFASAVTFASGGVLPKAVEIADFDGDGNLDLAIANSGSDANHLAPGFDPNAIDPGNITVFFGAGDGTFGAPLSFEVGIGPRSLAIADIDDDGKPDISTANYYDHTVSVLFNDTQISSTLRTTINVTASNDAPDVTVPGPLSGLPNTAISLTGIVFADPDGGGGGQTETATFTAPSGAFNAVDGGGVTVTGGGTGTLTLTGSIVDLNAFISGDLLTFTGTSPTNVHVVINDLGQTGGGALTDFADISIDINQPPVIANNGPAVSYTELTTPVLIDSDLTVTDGDDATLDHATVTIAPTFVTGDELRINGDLTGTVGAITFNYDSGTRTLSLTGTDTVANYQSLLDLVTFNNTSQNPSFFGFAPTRTITWLANDGVSDSAAVTTTINIVPINSPPDFALPPRTPVPYTEGLTAVIARDEFGDPLQVADIDGPTPIKGGTITISSGHIAGDRITWLNLASGDDFDDAIEFNFNPVTGVFTFTTIDPGNADYETFFNRLQFSFRADDNPLNLAFGDDPTAGGTDLTRTLTWQIDDGGASDNLSTPVDQIININAINDAPVISIAGSTLDIVTANFNSGDVSALLGDGLGGFTPQPPHPAVDPATDVALGDLNGDDILDIVVASPTGFVSVSLGNGVGGFGSQISYGVAGEASAVALGDVNGDDILDIVSANKSTDNVSVLLGDGSGGFGLQTPHLVGDAPSGVAVADINHDGKLDILTTNLASNDVSILLGDGLGGFTAQPVVAVGAAPVSIALGDLTGDGIPDLVTANSADDNVSILSNNGSGSFSGFTLPVGDNPIAVAMGDVTGDGKLDIVVANSIDNNVTVLPGNGFGAFFLALTLTVANGPSSVAVGDVNGDGILDIVTTYTGSNNVSVLLANGSGGFTTLMPQSIGTGDGPVSLALGDVNNALVVDEDTDLPITGLSIADPDAASGILTMTLHVTNGTLTVVGSPTTIGGSGSDTVTLTGTLAQINATLSALNGVIYRGAQDSSGPDTLEISINDNSHTGSGGPLTDTAEIPITVTAVNDAPLLDLDGDNSTASGADFAALFLAGGGAVPVADTDSSIVDVDDDNIEQATITLTNPQSGDALGIAGGLPPGISLDGASTSTNIILTGSATKAAYETALEQIRFNNANLAPDTTTRLIEITLSDGDVSSNTAIARIVLSQPPSTPADTDPAANSVAEGAGEGTLVGIDADSIDPEGAAVTYALGTNPGGFFSIDSTTGVVSVSLAGSAGLDFETQPVGGYVITVRATDTVGAFSTQDFTINVTNVAPTQPVDLNLATNTISEGAANGATVAGFAPASSDPAGTAVVFSLTNDAGGRFAIDASTGTLTVLNAALLNFESNASHLITVQASDGFGGTNTTDFTITVTNVAPVSTGDVYGVNEDNTLTVNAAAGVLLNDSDVHGGAITAVLDSGPAHAASFVLQSDGSFSYTPSANFNGADSFTYHASDGTAAGNTVTVNLNVAAINDAPVLGGVPASRLLPADGAALNVAPALTVGDVDSSSLTSATVRVSAGSFVGANDVLAANTAGTSITAFYDPATETLTLSGSDTLAHYQQVLASVTFDTTDTNPGNSGLNPTRTIEWQLNDGSAANNLSSITTTTINVSQQSPSDFNGDAVSDVLWRLNNGFVAEWLMSEGAISQNLGVGLPDPVWHFQDTGDFGADGMADILWRHDSGQAVLWQMDGATILSNQSVAAIGNDWHNEGVADFGGDGKADVLWHNDSGQVALWTMDGAQITNNQSVGNIDASWHVQGLLDTGGDGKSDVLLRNDSGQVVLWTMDSAQITANQSVTNNLGLDWNIVGTGDFGGDGKSDVLLRNDSGQVVIWTMDGNQIVDNQSVGTPGNEWHVQDVGDYNLDGHSDVLWRNDSGQVVVWEMNGAQIVSNHTVTYQGGTPAPIGLEWTVQNHHYDVL